MTDDDPATTGGEPPLPDPQQDSVIDPASALDGLDPAALLAQAASSGPAPTPTGRWMPPPMEEISGLLTGYQITALLGRGGMGAVYRGLQVSLDREVAIKLLPPELGIDPEFEARFKREAKSMAKLNHSNIVQIYDFGQTTAGHYYFVMEYVDGCDLHQLIRDGLLDVEGALNAVSQICDALQYAHDMGFVHRDIKPANIFINQQGILKVGDFGLAKLVGGDDAGHDNDLAGLTGSGIALGTMHYIAPEQLAEGMVDRRADIYSLGVMFYQMLTRELPRGAVKEPSKRVAMLDVRIDGVVFKAMDPDPDDRYQSASDLRTDVDRIRLTPHAGTEAAGEKIQSGPTASGNSDRGSGRRLAGRRILVRPPEPAATRGSRRNGGARVMTVFAGLAIIGGLAWWVSSQTEKTSEIEGAAALGFQQTERLISVETTPLESAPVAEEPVVVTKVPVPAGKEHPPEAAPPVPTKATITITATKERPFENSLGMKFVPVPGSNVLFCIHETRMQDYAAYADLHPVDDSWKNGNFNNKPISSDPLHPAVAMTRDEANGFCLWLTEKEIARGTLSDGMRYRLPTDQEWNWAVGLGDDEGVIPDERNRKNQVDFPWGSIFPPVKPAGNYAPGPWGDDGYESTAPVGSFPPNQLGIHDLGGNVWELCQEFVAKDDRCMIRGASWLDSRRDLMLSSFRNFCGKNTRNSNLGFRCVLEHSTSSATSVSVSPTPVSHPASVSADGWIDLLALVDPEKDTLSGKWTRVSDGLHGEKLPDGKGAQHLQLPYEAPEEYDFRITLTHLMGNCEATQILCAGDRQFIWGTASGQPDKWSGFNMINGKPMMQNGAGVKLPKPREVNRRYESLVEVRRDRVTGYIDGQKLVERKTNYQDMTPDPAYIMTNPKALGVGIWWSKTVFHEIAVREVTGKGKVLRSTLPPQASGTTTTATKDAPFVNSLGMKFVPVPGTRILMCIHETRKGDYRTFASANPAVNGGWLNPSRDGVSVSTADDHPVCNVSWEDSKAFCDWLSKKEGRTYRLPTDREWSMAVGIGGREDTSLTPASLTDKLPGEYIWGTEWPPPKGAGNYADTATIGVLPALKIIEGYTDGFGTTAPVMSFTPNKLGLYDLAGNVWEYNDDYYNKAQDIRTVRGGCWIDGGLAGRRPFLASGRNGDDPEMPDVTRGFRCALVMNAEAASATSATTSPINAQPFFLGRWYQTFDGRATPYYITDFTPDGKVTAFTTEGKRSTANWQVTAVTLRIEWDNGVSYVIPLPMGGDQKLLAGNAVKPGEVAPSSRVQLTRELPSESGLKANDPDDGFVSLFQNSSTAGWEVHGPGAMDVKNGVVTMRRTGNGNSYLRYTKKSFQDFHLRVEFQITNPGANSGIFVRFPDPNAGSKANVESRAYQIDVSDLPGGMEATGAICFVKPPSSVPQKSGWNELDVEVRGHHYLVKLNGVEVNDFTGGRELSGYIGLQIYKPDGMQFRNLRVKEL